MTPVIIRHRPRADHCAAPGVGLLVGGLLIGAYYAMQRKKAKAETAPFTRVMFANAACAYKSTSVLIVLR